MMTAAAVTYRILAENLIELQERLAKLNKRARRLGIEEIALTVGERHTKWVKGTGGIDYESISYDCSVNVPSVALADWSLVAVIEPQQSGERLIKCVPGEECPHEYRTGGLECDHCGHARYRKQVFIVRHANGEHRQVGRNCLADFLGHDAESFLAHAQFVRDIDDLGHFAEEGFGGRAPTCFNAAHFLGMVAIIVRKIGWTPRSGAGEGRPATADLAFRILAADKRDEYAYELRQTLVADEQEGDVKLAEQALAWAKELPTTASDYLYNLGVACRNEIVDYKSAGMIASAVSAYKRHVEREALKRVESEGRKPSLHQGTVGVRQVFKGLTVVSVKSFDGAYGVTTMIRLLDASGNVFVWWASGEGPQWAEVEKIVDIKATVKKHDDYQGTPQTILSRAALA